MATVDTVDVRIYEPHKGGLPKLRNYFTEALQRRHFAVELSKAEMKAANSDTVFGRLWLLLNPILTAGIYFMLVIIIGGGKKGPDFFVHLVAALFAFQFVQGAMSAGASSVVGGGKLVLNTSFPLILLPTSAIRTSLNKFLPTLAIFAAFFIYFATFAPKTEFNTLHFSWNQLWAVPALGLIIVFTAGMTLLMATVQVYFRDITSFLPYVTRMWLYLSPVLYFADQMKPWMLKFEILNPLFPLLAIWGNALVRDEGSPLSWWLMGIAWSFGIFFFSLWLFLTREREFPVRIS